MSEEIAELMKRAEQADQSGDEPGQSLPEELAHRRALREKVTQARRKLEERAQARAEAERKGYEKKLSEREKRPGHRRGPKPKATSPVPEPQEQINLTDEDSRIMRKSCRSEYQQAYNCQAAVDADGSQSQENGFWCASPTTSNAFWCSKQAEKQDEAKKRPAMPSRARFGARYWQAGTTPSTHTGALNSQHT